jgi:NADH dehydrogenase [ubiquinone] 1 alpha subcomplex assembly factor 7
VTALAELIARRIRMAGPITVAEYMAEALGHPEHGYYTRKDPLGRAGDFTTAPEMSQMFGELVGLWCLATWRALGEPRPFRLVELGPGRGTLMADALRALARTRPDEVHLVETSPALRAVQETTLAGAGAAWHRDLAEVPEGPMALIANELFDALPVRQFERTPEGWRERMVGLDEGGRLRFALSPAPAPCAIDRPVGAVVELAPAAIALAEAIGARVAAHPGAALIVDFAVAEPGLPTLQAVRAHGRAEPLERPGDCDLAAAVDFAALAEAGARGGARVFGPAAQGTFLRALGIGARARRLKANATAAQSAAIEAALHRLTGENAMGRLFQALAIASPSLREAPGFGGPPC